MVSRDLPRTVSAHWILLGHDAELLGSLAATAPADCTITTTATGIGASVRTALAEGAQRFAIVGGDRELHAAVEAMRVCIDEGWARPPLQVRFPDDPSIDPTETIRLLIALLPTEPGGLAATLGLAADPRATISMLGTDHAWGPLDVGIVTADDRTSVLVSTLDIGIDAVERPRFGARPSIQVTIDIEGRRARRRRDVAMLHRGPAEPLGWIAIANGQYERLARIAPRAIPHDRAFDVLIGRGDVRAVRRWRRTARHAGHVPDPAIDEWLSDRITLGFDRPIVARLDGDAIGAERLEVRLTRLGIALKI